MSEQFSPPEASDMPAKTPETAPEQPPSFHEKAIEILSWMADELPGITGQELATISSLQRDFALLQQVRASGVPHRFNQTQLEDMLHHWDIFTTSVGATSVGATSVGERRPAYLREVGQIVPAEVEAAPGDEEQEHSVAKDTPADSDTTDSESEQSDAAAQEAAGIEQSLEKLVALIEQGNDLLANSDTGSYYLLDEIIAAAEELRLQTSDVQLRTSLQKISNALRPHREAENTFLNTLGNDLQSLKADIDKANKDQQNQAPSEPTDQDTE